MNLRSLSFVGRSYKFKTINPSPKNPRKIGAGRGRQLQTRGSLEFRM